MKIILKLSLLLLAVFLSLLFTIKPEDSSMHSKSIVHTEKNDEMVVLLHGLRRSADSMSKLEVALSKNGYQTLNINYPSTEYKIGKLLTIIDKIITPLTSMDNLKLHFVTHSMGGILTRAYLKEKNIPNLGRVVMLSPPNHGSEVVDHLKNWNFFVWWNGPAVLQLGTDPNSIPNKLGPVNFDLGIITGNDFFFLDILFTKWFSGPHDGKVSVKSAMVEGMHDFLALPVSHTFIMTDPEVIEQVIYYLENGKFKKS